MKYTVKQGNKVIMQNAAPRQIEDMVGIKSNRVSSYAEHGLLYKSEYSFIAEGSLISEKSLSLRKVDPIYAEWENVCEPFRKLSRRVIL